MMMMNKMQCIIFLFFTTSFSSASLSQESLRCPEHRLWYTCHTSDNTTPAYLDIFLDCKSPEQCPNHEFACPKGIERSSLRLALEPLVPFRQSHLWNLMLAFYERQGINSWSKGIVPHFVTSNTYIGNTFANLFYGFLQDGTQPNAELPLNPQEKMYIFELGTGPGKFTFNFVKELVRMEKILPFPIENIVYVMTDFTENNFNFWTTHPALKPYVDRGLLDFAIFNCIHDTEMTLHHAKTKLGPGVIKNPIVIFGNYIFDTLYSDIFQIKNGLVREGLFSAGSKRVFERDVNNPEIIERMSNQFKYRSSSTSFYNETSDGPDYVNLNGVLQWYQQHFKKEDGSFLLPYTPFTVMRNLMAMANHRGIVLSADKGEDNVDFYNGLDNPFIATHGSFSITVNYHAMGIYMALRNGFALHNKQNSHDITVSAFIMKDDGAASQDRSKWSDAEITALLDHKGIYAERAKKMPWFEQAFNRLVIDFGPNDYYIIQALIDDHHDMKLTIGELMAIMKLSRWDPETFHRYSEDLITSCDKYHTESQALDIQLGLPTVWSNYYELDVTFDLALQIGRTYFSIGDYENATLFYGYSYAKFGQPRVTKQFMGVVVYNMALSYYSMDNYTMAKEFFQKALVIDPEDDDIIEWIKAVEKKM